MNLSIVRSLSLLGILLFAGCAARRYRATPIVPAETASRFPSRTLNDADLQALLAKNPTQNLTVSRSQARNVNDADLQAFRAKNPSQTMTASPPKSWDLRMLWLAAQYFNPALEAGRAPRAGTGDGGRDARHRPTPTA